LKKLIALVTVFTFAIALAGMVYADSRTPADKLEAGRAYLKLLDQKIIRLRKDGKTALVKQMQADKKSTIDRMKEWKAEAEGGTSAPVAPTAPPPPPVAVRPAPAAAGAGWFGWGLNTGYTAGYLAGNSVVLGRADLILSDGLGIGPMVGLADDAISWKVGLGGALGTDSLGRTSRKSIPLFVDGIINLPADLLGGVESYIGGGVNYPLSGTGGSGTLGIQAYYGVQGDIGLGGNTYAELTYSVIRTGANTFPYSMKGIGLNVGTQILL